MLGFGRLQLALAAGYGGLWLAVAGYGALRLFIVSCGWLWLAMVAAVARGRLRLAMAG